MDRSPVSLSVAPAPHVRKSVSPDYSAFDLLIALLPALIIGVLSFGARAAVLAAVGAVCAWLFSAIAGLIKKSPAWSDASSAMTGLLLAMLLPANAPIFIPALGAFVAVIVVRELTGGASKNIFNPAMAAVIFILLVFPDMMNDLPSPRSSLEWFGDAPNFYVNHLSGFWAALSGKGPASIGTVCPAALIAGGVYLLMRKVSDRKITASCLATAFILPACFVSLNDALLGIINGPLIFTVLFLASDPVTSPVTSAGKIIYGVGLGFLAVIIKNMGVYSDGAGFALLLMNTLVWFIDLKLVPKLGRIIDFFADLAALAAAGFKKRFRREVKE